MVQLIVMDFKEIWLWVELPFRLLWNLLVLIAAISLTIAWLVFLFGSVLGVILLLIFFPTGFFLPMALMVFCVELFPVRAWWEE
jgi:hypothetical protein